MSDVWEFYDHLMELRAPDEVYDHLNGFMSAARSL